MKRDVILAGLATLAVIASGAPADAQLFGDDAYGGWASRSSGFSYATGPVACAQRYRPARVKSHGRVSGFCLESSPYSRAYPPYNCYGRGHASIGWPVEDWLRYNSRVPMH
jgi:hypothetical protein